MFSRSSLKYAAAFFVIGSLFGASVSAFMAPTAEVQRARFDERPGAWMYHCHILDHAEAGMMGHLVVRDPNAPDLGAPPVMHRHD